MYKRQDQLHAAETAFLTVPVVKVGQSVVLESHLEDYYKEIISTCLLYTSFSLCVRRSVSSVITSTLLFSSDREGNFYFNGRKVRFILPTGDPAGDLLDRKGFYPCSVTIYDKYGFAAWGRIKDYTSKKRTIV